MNKCIKCGSDDLCIKYIEKGKLITSSHMGEKVYKEFLHYSEYDYYWNVTAEKEHLYKHCRTCQYNWREDIVSTDTKGE